MEGKTLQTLPVAVKFYGTMRDVVDGPETTILVPAGATVGDFLRCLVDKYGERFFERVMTVEGGLKSYVKVFINNQEVDSSDLARPLIADGTPTEAIVYVLPAMTGG